MTNIDTDVEGTPALTMLASSCASGTCPTIFESDRGTYVIQGYAVDARQAGVALGSDELLVEIPVELLAGILAERGGTSGN
jgi:hypothetical protein